MTRASLPQPQGAELDATRERREEIRRIACVRPANGSRPRRRECTTRRVRRTSSLRDALRGTAPLAQRCLDVVGLTDAGSDLKVADCAVPHDAEYAGAFKVPRTPWPTDEQPGARCAATAAARSASSATTSSRTR